MNEMYLTDYKCKPERDEQTHVHEVLGSVRIVEIRKDKYGPCYGDSYGEECHNHRFAGVTDEEIPVPGGHIHKLVTKTDFYEDHFHPICVFTQPQVKVGECDDARHVHFIDSCTQVEDGHQHHFIAATLIENPIGEEKKPRYPRD